MMQVPGNPFHVASSSFDIGSGCAGNHGNGRHQHSNSLASNSSSDGHGSLNGGFRFGQKRKRLDVEETMEEPRCKRCSSLETNEFRGRNFLPIKGSATVYQSEVVKPKGETMYRPLTDDILINMRHIEQVSFGSGLYFIGDQRGNYERSDHGHVINMWRFDPNQQRLFISRSLLFIDPMRFGELQNVLQTM